MERAVRRVGNAFRACERDAIGTGRSHADAEEHRFPGGEPNVRCGGSPQEVQEAAHQVEAKRRDVSRPATLQEVARQLARSRDERATGGREPAVPARELPERIDGDLPPPRISRYVACAPRRAVAPAT